MLQELLHGETAAPHYSATGRLSRRLSLPKAACRTQVAPFTPGTCRRAIPMAAASPANLGAAEGSGTGFHPLPLSASLNFPGQAGCVPQKASPREGPGGLLQPSGTRSPWEAASPHRFLLPPHSTESSCLAHGSLLLTFRNPFKGSCLP